MILNCFHQFMLKFFIMRSNMSRRLVYDANCLLLLTSFLLFSIFIVQSNGKTLTEKIRERMDESIDPCNDFYNFACGGYMKTVPIPETRDSLTPLDELNIFIHDQTVAVLAESVSNADSHATDIVKRLFRSCLQTDKLEEIRLEPFEKLLEELGGWPVVLGDTWQESEFSVAETNYKNRELGFSTNYLLNLNVDLDWINTSKRIITISEGDFKIELELLLLGIKSKPVQDFLNFSINVAEHFGANPNRARTEMKEVVEFVIQLAKASQYKEKDSTVSELEEVYNVSWIDYTKTILKREDINGSEPVKLKIRLGKLEELFAATSKRTIANYIILRVIIDAIPFLPSELRELYYEYDKASTGKTVMETRGKECVDILNKKLPHAIANLYVKRYLDMESRSEVKSLVDHIKHEFSNILNEIDWMDNQTKSIAREKLGAMKSVIAYPPEMMNETILNAFYQPLSVNESLLTTMRNIEIFLSDAHYRNLREKTASTRWQDYPPLAEAQAYADLFDNAIIISAGILRRHYFGRTRPKYVNYATMGHVLGHEITHHFDTWGKLFDKNGNLFTWWDNETENEFSNRTECMVDQYNAFNVTEVNMNVDGIRSLSENIADNGGVKEAYRAYQTWVRENGEEQKLPGMSYSPNQIFWIANAQNWCSKYRPEFLVKELLSGYHAPGRFRIYGSLMNLREFSADWNCAVGSNMNPTDKCKVW